MVKAVENIVNSPKIYEWTVGSLKWTLLSHPLDVIHFGKQYMEATKFKSGFGKSKILTNILSFRSDTLQSIKQQNNDRKCKSRK